MSLQPPCQRMYQCWSVEGYQRSTWSLDGTSIVVSRACHVTFPRVFVRRWILSLPLLFTLDTIIASEVRLRAVPPECGYRTCSDPSVLFPSSPLQTSGTVQGLPPSRGARMDLVS